MVAMSTGTLGPRALNRATLARQYLLEPTSLPPLAVVERLAGIQAQAPWPPYYALWSRIAGFRQEDLAALIVDRSVVRIALMRGTVHLVSAADCLMLRPLTQAVHDRGLRGSFGRLLEGLDLDRLAAAGRALVEERPLTMAELGAALAAHPRGDWGDRNPNALAQAVRARVPLVQVPPRGVWGQGGQTRVTSAEAWLGRPLDAEPDPGAMVLRYLAAFGPATVMDVQTWSGLTRLKPVLERLRPELVVFRDERGKELFDLPGAPRPSPDAVAPVRFLAEFENMLLSYADRSRIMSEDARKRVFDVKNGVFPGTFTVDGFVAGTWRIERGRGRVTLRLQPYEPLSRAGRSALEEEGHRLLAFEDASAGHGIEFVD
jgi:hypothetical protein